MALATRLAVSLNAEGDVDSFPSTKKKISSKTPRTVGEVASALMFQPYPYPYPKGPKVGLGLADSNALSITETRQAQRS